MVSRRLPFHVPNFPSPYDYTRYWPSSERTLWFPKERIGRSTERLPLRHSQRYISSAIRRVSTSPIKAERDYQRNNKLVWDETIRIMMDLFDNVWGDRPQVVVDDCVDITLPVRFLWLRHSSYPFLDIPTRLPFSSSASQVVYSPLQLL